MESAAENAKHDTVFDSDQQLVGDVYAKAFIGACQSAGNTEQALDELTSFAESLRKLPQVRLVMVSPRIGVDEKLGLLDKILSSSGSPTKEVAHFLKVLCRRGRFNCLDMIAISARKMFNESAGRTSATIITAAPIDEQTKSRVVERLAKLLGKQVEVDTVVDPEILGGLVVKIGDTVYDGSLSNQLNRVRRGAIERATQQIKQSIDRFTIDA